MKSKIFLIYENPSDYESYPTVVGYTTTEEMAKSVVAEKIKEYQDALVWSEKLDTKRREFKESNPPFVFKPCPQFKKWPSGIGKKDITKEMQHERDETQMLINKVQERNSKNMREYTAKELSYIEVVFMSIPVELYKYFDKMTKYMNAEHLVESQPYYFEECKEI